ncbi:gypsy type transposase [Tanacetum coccineum]|uniref:Gypsy type transposase n=1 Tax=Tanacetum coccineum TaxID=301880 RepID=A0ABQ5HX00_9ASTR
MTEFLQLPNFKGCKVAAGELLPPGSARVTHLSSPAERLEDLPPKTRDMVTAELPCRKVLDDKEKKKRKAEAKAAVDAPGADTQVEKVVRDKGAGKEGARKKRRVRVGTPVHPGSEHVSSPTMLNHANPLETLANEQYVSPNASIGRMGALRNQTDKNTTPPPIVNAGEFVTGENVQENDAAIANEGHGDNEGGISGLQTQPSPSRPADHLLETVEKPVRDKIVPEVEASYSAGRFGNLPFTPQWGLKDSCRMDNSRLCRDMMLNLDTRADNEFFNEGVRNESAIKRSWKLLCQSAQQQANTLLRFEALTEEHTNLVYTHESCKDVKARYKECRKELAKAQSAYDEKTSAYDQLSKNYVGALTREKSLQDRLEELEEEKKETEQLNSAQADRINQLEEALRQSEADAHQLRLDKERYAVEDSNEEMVLCKDPDVQAILKATPNVNPTSVDIFMETYEKLFDVQAILKATPNEYNTTIFIPSYLILKGQRYTFATLINQRTSSNNQVVDQDKSST